LTFSNRDKFSFSSETGKTPNWPGEFGGAFQRPLGTAGVNALRFCDLMERSNIVCETSRLLLRQFTRDDLGSPAAIHLDAQVTRFLGGVKTSEQTRDRLEQWLAEYERYGFSKWAVVLPSSEELIGRCGLSLEQIDGVDVWELGWTFARAYWSKGYATEAAQAAMEYSFRVLGHRRLISLIRLGNIASVRVVERIGMNYERRVQWNGMPADMYARMATQT
jgi:[ribosomal protein S5]-alanine N-acetyltransferase